MILNQIQQTKNYKQFKKLTGNRPVDKNHVKFLSKSIALNNMLPAHPIIVNEKMEVIDGQHRLEVAQQTGVAIYYFILEGAGLKQTLLLNTYARVWRIKDWLNSYVSLGFADYIILAKTLEAHPKISVSNMISIFTPETSFNQNAFTMKAFRLGNFKADQKAFAEDFLFHLERIEGLLASRVVEDRELILALIKATKFLSMEEIADKIIEVGKVIERQVGIREYLHTLEDILNYKRKVLIRLF